MFTRWVLDQLNFPPSSWPVVFLTQSPDIVPRHSHIGEVVEKMAEDSNPIISSRFCLVLGFGGRY